jgi:hypothetical protein
MGGVDGQCTMSCMQNTPDRKLVNLLVAVTTSSMSKLLDSVPAAAATFARYTA